MAPITTQWTRLIRFVAVETSQVHIGEPVDHTLDVGLAFEQQEPIKAYEILGSALDPDAQLTATILTVKQLLAPLAPEQVGLVRGLGLNYSDHAAEVNLAKPTIPILFYKPVTALIGPSAPIVVPSFAQPAAKHIPDYEAELAIVIGKPAKNVSESDALDYVLAYTAANDISFRHHQMATSQWSFSKGFDNTTPIGPCLVSATRLTTPQQVPLKCVLNGEVVQDGNTSNMIFSVAQAISYLSSGTTLQPGSIIMTGTPKGVGFAKKPPIYLKHGDRVSVWIGLGIGTIANTVFEEGKYQSPGL